MKWEQIRKSGKIAFKKMWIYLVVICIPCLLILDSIQAKRFSKIEREVKKIESSQYELIEANKRLIAGISVLSSPERIEQLAKGSLQMRKASPDEIIRVQVKR
ncbi:MAG: cell division protein FtsL [Treponemataceae bacterium]